MSKLEHNFKLWWYILDLGGKVFLNRVIFLSGPPRNLLSAGQYVTDFKKTLRVPDWPPLWSKKVLSVYWFSFVEDLEGGQSRDLWVGPV